VNTSVTPEAPGGTQQAALQGGANATHVGDPRFDTADFADGAPGNLRADYVLPSSNTTVVGSGVFWPENTDPNFPLVGTFNSSNPFAGFPSSDHRAVWVDVAVPVPEPETYALMAVGLGLIASTMRRRRAIDR